MFEPIKIAFGEFLGQYYQGLVATTKPLSEFNARGLGKSIQFAPSRMMGAAADMLTAWQRNDTDSAPTAPPKLPVIIVVMGQDIAPTGRNFNRQLPDPTFVMLDGDVKERLFRLRTLASDLRVQVAIFAADEPTARSLAAQFGLFLDARGNRRFYAQFATPIGTAEGWPVLVESPQVPFVAVPTEAQNLCILSADLTLKATVPLYDAPATDNLNNDQSGTPGTIDPSGYLGVRDIDIEPQEAPP